MISFKGFCQFPGYADGDVRVQRRQGLHGFNDAVGGFIKNTGIGRFRCRLEHGVFFPGFNGQKTAEEEGVRRQSGSHQSRHHGGRTGKNSETYALFLERLNETVARIAHARHARITDHGKAFPASRARRNFPGARLFIVVMHAYQRFADFIMGKQKSRVAGVFTRNDIHLAQHVQRPQSNVRPVADRHRNKINAVFHFLHKC